MLKSTFIHIPGVGRTKEQLLHQNGIRTWDEFLHNNITCLPPSTLEYIRKNIEISTEQYNKKNHKYFAQSLPASEHWRAYPHFRTCYIDIETTGLSYYNNKITTIGAYDGEQSKIYIRGMNLESFKDDIRQYSTIVTFNGARFDLPFIQHQLNIRFSHIHIDLMYALRDLGLRGGLKRIEKQMGISRDDEIEGVDGLEAVRLWKKYEKGDRDALRKLVAYNLADVENLKQLMEFAYRKKSDILFGK